VTTPTAVKRAPVAAGFLPDWFCFERRDSGCNVVWAY